MPPLRRVVLMRPSPPQREQRCRILPLPEQVPHFVEPEASQGTQTVAPLQVGQEWGVFGAGAEGSSAPTGTSEPNAIARVTATSLRNVFIVEATMKRAEWFGGYKFAEGFEALPGLRRVARGMSARYLMCQSPHHPNLDQSIRPAN